MSKSVYFALALVLVGFYFLQVYKPSMSDEEVAANRQAGVDYLAANEHVEGVNVTRSGLQYKVLQQGTGSVHPALNDRVTVHYEGMFIDGSVFDSSLERGEPISFPLAKVIEGWKQALPLMVVGDKTRFFIPASLAYGDNWAGDIPPGSALIFDVELLAINDVKN